MLSLSHSVQRRVVALALRRGRYDPDGRARAAAFRANYAAYGNAFLHEAVMALLPARISRDGKVSVTAQYSLLPELLPGQVVSPEPFLAVFELLRAGGLPGTPGTPAEAIDRRLSQLHALMQVVHDFTAYPDRVRATAMATLGDVSGAGFQSMREEDWEGWWTEYRLAETERLRKARAMGADDEEGA